MIWERGKGGGRQHEAWGQSQGYPWVQSANDATKQLWVMQECQDIQKQDLIREMA